MSKFVPKPKENDEPNSKDSFEVNSFEIQERERATTRRILTPAILSTCALFLLGSAWIGMENGKFDELKTVWGIVGPLIGVLTGYYYRSDHDYGKRNH